MKHGIAVFSLLLLAACTESHTVRVQDTPRDNDAGDELEPDAGETLDEDAGTQADAGAPEPRSLLPRPPTALARPPVDGKLPDELRPPTQ